METEVGGDDHFHECVPSTTRWENEGLEMHSTVNQTLWSGGTQKVMSMDKPGAGIGWFELS